MQFEANLKEVISRADNVKSFRFARPPKFEYRPGQFFFITIKIGGKEAKKHFTISSSPSEREFLEFTKKLTGHQFSDALDKLKEGNWIKINGPYGRFTFEGRFSKVGMLTGGIGITPLRSMIRYCTDMKIRCDIVLLYSNRTESDIIFREELENFQKHNPNLKTIFTLTRANGNWNGYSGRIDKEMILTEIPDFKERFFFTCGPPGLVKNIVELLIELDVEKEKIRTENFPGY